MEHQFPSQGPPPPLCPSPSQDLPFPPHLIMTSNYVIMISTPSRLFSTPSRLPIVVVLQVQAVCCTN